MVDVRMYEVKVGVRVCLIEVEVSLSCQEKTDRDTVAQTFDNKHGPRVACPA